MKYRVSMQYISKTFINVDVEADSPDDAVETAEHLVEIGDLSVESSDEFEETSVLGVDELSDDAPIPERA